MESTVGYSDSIGSPATDEKSAYEVLFRGCEIKDRLQLNAVVCVFDQAFYAKAIEAYWKHKELFVALVIIIRRFSFVVYALESLESDWGMQGLEN